VAQQTHTQLVERKGLVGDCHLLAFFLNELLHSKYSIETDLVVGWVLGERTDDDGRDDSYDRVCGIVGPPASTIVIARIGSLFLIARRPNKDAST
jgi:hypothetical protein